MIRHEIDAKTAMLYGDKKLCHVVLQQIKSNKPIKDEDGFYHEVEIAGSDLMKLVLLYLVRGSWRLRQIVSSFTF